MVGHPFPSDEIHVVAVLFASKLRENLVRKLLAYLSQEHCVSVFVKLFIYISNFVHRTRRKHIRARGRAWLRPICYVRALVDCLGKSFVLVQNDGKKAFVGQPAVTYKLIKFRIRNRVTHAFGYVVSIQHEPRVVSQTQFFLKPPQIGAFV